MVKELQGIIVSHVSLGEEYRELVLKVPGMEAACPGQFAGIRVGPGHDPLLRRPLSIYRHVPEEETLHFLYRLVGRGTRLLSQAKRGQELHLLAPLGRGFSLEGLTPDTPAVLVAGGVGAAPLGFLASKLKGLGIPQTFFLGGSTRDHLPFREGLETLSGSPPVITTEDGSLGTKGLVTDALKSFLHHAGRQQYRFFACGPGAMLRETARVVQAAEGGLLQVSLESVMACGFGACLGCAYPGKDGEKPEYKRVCTEGPVFFAGEVML